MKRLTKVSIAAACALGVSAVYAQSVQRGDKVLSQPATQTVAQASSTAPIQTAQAGAGAAAGGASTAGAAAGATAAGTLVGTAVFVGAAVAATAVASDTNATPTTNH
jgi:hypothetical protein